MHGASRYGRARISRKSERELSPDSLIANEICIFSQAFVYLSGSRRCCAILARHFTVVTFAYQRLLSSSKHRMRTLPTATFLSLLRSIIGNTTTCMSISYAFLDSFPTPTSTRRYLQLVRGDETECDGVHNIVFARGSRRLGFDGSAICKTLLGWALSFNASEFGIEEQKSEDFV